MDNVDEFTIHLPSNTLFMESNTASKYTVNLAMPVNLSGEWECGLEEIHYPHTWVTMPEGVAKMEILIADVRTSEFEKIPVNLAQNPV